MIVFKFNGFSKIFNGFLILFVITIKYTSVKMSVDVIFL